MKSTLSKWQYLVLPIADTHTHTPARTYIFGNTNFSTNQPSLFQVARNDGFEFKDCLRYHAYSDNDVVHFGQEGTVDLPALVAELVRFYTSKTYMYVRKVPATM